MSSTILSRALNGNDRLSREEALALLSDCETETLMQAAAQRRDSAHGVTVSYSRKVFIPLTQLCRDVCHYCTFAQAPRGLAAPYLSPDDVLKIASDGAAAGCKEALFTLGDKPELRYRAAREWLEAHGYQTTIDYLIDMAGMVLRETGLLPHMNAGIVDEDDIARLRQVSASQGIMLESASPRLCNRGLPHFGSPDKDPTVRLACIEAAGRQKVPFTSGILIGIGETWEERIDALLELRRLNDAHGHIQEIIVQNFQPKPDTKMRDVAPPPLDDHLRTIAIARLMFEPEMNIQAPPNLSPDALSQIVDAGINDWGGVSPVTPDYVNPEAPWPEIVKLSQATAAAGKHLAERLAIYPHWARVPAAWVDAGVAFPLGKLMDGDGWARTSRWSPGGEIAQPPAEDIAFLQAPAVTGSDELEGILARAMAGTPLSEAQIVRLFRARGPEFTRVCQAADALRREVNGNTVSYVVTRNINYTNICGYKCQFCAFSKGKTSENLRGKPYDLDVSEVARRAVEAQARGGTEVCMQGGIHPRYTGQHYLDLCRAVKAAAPGIHVHAFSPLEVTQGARTLGISLEEFLIELKRAGLGSLPGTAAEILDDEVREALCANKIVTDEWLDVMRTAHRVGLRSTATIMFGHIEGYRHWARHLIRVRDLQIETGGFTEFVPLPFVHMESPLFLKKKSRPGPTFRETVLMHAVARLALHPHIQNIQTSWVKLGPEGVKHCLASGVNDMGGTLMDESISRAAGAAFGQEMTPQTMHEIIEASGRTPRQRTTLYGALGALAAE